MGKNHNLCRVSDQYIVRFWLLPNLVSFRIYNDSDPHIVVGTQ